MKLYTKLLFCLLVLVLAGCDKIGLSKTKVVPKSKSQIQVIKGTVIAKVNNTPIILEDLNREIDSYNAMVPPDKAEAKITTRDQKLNYVKNEMVRRALLYQDAITKGLDKKDEVNQALEKTKQDLLVMELIRQEAEKVEVSSTDIEDYYNTYKEQLKEPEERQIAEIVVSGEQEAKDILIQLLQGQDFNDLARSRSKTPSAKDGGDLGFITRGKKSPQFDAIAFSDSLDAGKVSSIFKGPDGYTIIKVVAKRGGRQRSLSEMWDDIKKGLTFVKQQQKIEEMIGKLSRDAKIEVYEGEIK